MNSECFFTISLILDSWRYSCRPSLTWRTILVPRPIRGDSSSNLMVKDPPALDSQMYCSEIR